MASRRVVCGAVSAATRSTRRRSCQGNWTVATRLTESNGIAELSRSIYISSRNRRGSAPTARLPPLLSRGTKTEPATTHSVTMPRISDEVTHGRVTKWMAVEGQMCPRGSEICEVEYPAFSLNLTVDEDSYIAKILVQEGDTDVAVGTPLCICGKSEESAAEYRAAHAPKASVAEFKFTAKDIMKFIHALMKESKIDEEFASHLLQLARHENRDLYEAFDSAFETEEFSAEALDADFFLLQAKDIVKEHFPQPPPAATPPEEAPVKAEEIPLAPVEPVEKVAAVEEPPGGSETKVTTEKTATEAAQPIGEKEPKVAIETSKIDETQPVSSAEAEVTVETTPKGEEAQPKKD